jgi:hypothetical protein
MLLPDNQALSTQTGVNVSEKKPNSQRKTAKQRRNLGIRFLKSGKKFLEKRYNFFYK